MGTHSLLGNQQEVLKHPELDAMGAYTMDMNECIANTYAVQACMALRTVLLNHYVT